MSEWITVALAATAIATAYRLGLLLTFVPVPTLGLALLELVMTILFYPLAAVITHFGLGVP